MKKVYQVLVEEKYTKYVDVAVDEEYEISGKIADMEEAGEIEWDRGADCDEWNILDYFELKPLDVDVEMAKEWCKKVVENSHFIDPGFLAKLTREACAEWLELMRDNGMVIPVLVTSADLMDAINELQKTESDK